MLGYPKGLRHQAPSRELELRTPPDHSPTLERQLTTRGRSLCEGIFITPIRSLPREAETPPQSPLMKTGHKTQVYTDTRHANVREVAYGLKVTDRHGLRPYQWRERHGNVGLWA